MNLKQIISTLVLLGVTLWVNPLRADSHDIFLDELERHILRFEYEKIPSYLDSIQKIQSTLTPEQELRYLWLSASYCFRNHIFDRSFELVNELYEKALIQNDSLYLGRAIYRTGTIFANIGELDVYLDHIGIAKELARLSGDLTTMARCKMGELNMQIEDESYDFDILRDSYNECIELVKDLNGDYAYDTQLAILFNLFNAYERKDRDFLKVVNAILELSKKAQRKDTYAGGLFRLHKHYMSEKDTLRALQSLKEAYTVADEINDNIILAEVSIALAGLYKSLNQLDKAYDYAMKVAYFNKAKEDKFRKAGMNALSRYGEIDELSSKNEALVKSNNLFVSNNLFLKKVTVSVGLFGLFLFLSGVFWIYHFRQKNMSKLIMAEQREQIWNERFRSAEKDRKLDLLTSFQKGQEIIRDRIAMVLHDKIAGGIAGIKLFLSNDPALSQPKIVPILNQLDELYDYSRNLSHFYYDPLPDDILFCDLVKKKVEQCVYNTGIELECILYPEGKINALSPLIKTEVLHYISELMRNVEKHSKATHGEVTVTLQEDGIYITVVDNGVGMNNNQVSIEGIGLQIIRKRLALLNGDIEISSQLTKGYTCIIFIPQEVILNTEKTKAHVQYNPN